MRHRSPFDRPRHALAGRRVELGRLGEREPLLLRGRNDRRRERMLAAPAPGSPRGAAIRRRAKPRRGRPARRRRGLPSVSVPVLSTTSVSTFSNRSSASAFLISTPDCAPRPTPTMIDIGVASPSAHGQAMISTETAATRPKAKRGSGPNIAQATKASDGDGDDQRHEPARHLVGEPLDRRPAALRLGHHLDDLRQHRVAADAFGAHDEAAALVDRPADRRGRRRVLATGIDSPVTIDSSTALAAFDDFAVDRDLLAWAHAQPVADRDRFERDILVARRRRGRAARSWARDRAARGSRRRSARGRAARAPARAARAR